MFTSFGIESELRFGFKYNLVPVNFFRIIITFKRHCTHCIFCEVPQIDVHFLGKTIVSHNNCAVAAKYIYRYNNSLP